MPSEKPLRRLEDILANIARIERFTAGMDQAAFGADDRAVYASLHALLIISEAARKLGAEASRLVEPHQLVSAGRRWYVVAWDVRRDDWRTFQKLARFLIARLSDLFVVETQVRAAIC